MFTKARTMHRHLVIAAALAVMLAGTPGLALAGQGGDTADDARKNVTLVGCLDSSQAATDDSTRFTLIERESGEWIAVEGSESLADHVGHTVELKGTWKSDGNGFESLAVSDVKMLKDSCEE